MGPGKILPSAIKVPTIDDDTSIADNDKETAGYLACNSMSLGLSCIPGNRWQSDYRSLIDLINSWIGDIMSIAPEHTEANPLSGVFDKRELVKILGNDDLAIDELTKLYRQTLNQQRTEIQQALKDSNWNSAVSLAHRLKSSSRVVGAFDLADYCETIENAGGLAARPIGEEFIDNFNKLSALVLKSIDEYLQKPIA